MKTIGFASVLLVKEDQGSATTTLTHHWQIGVESEDEMRGIAARKALEMKKTGFGIKDIIVSIVSEEVKG